MKVRGKFWVLHPEIESGTSSTAGESLNHLTTQLIDHGAGIGIGRHGLELDERGCHAPAPGQRVVKGARHEEHLRMPQAFTNRVTELLKWVTFNHCGKPGRKTEMSQNRSTRWHSC